jgi:poly-gamma-glutamate synthesis protein (capsule biosynthesis protein)
MAVMRSFFIIALVFLVAGFLLMGRHYTEPQWDLNPTVIRHAIPEQDDMTIFFGGDTMLDDDAMPLIAERGYDELFRNIGYLTKNSDIAIVNLEAPITTGGRPISLEKPGIFKQHPASIDAFEKAGIDIFVLANNHILDYGETGLDDTLRHLTEKKLYSLGAGMNEQEARRGIIVNIESRGESSLVRIGILSYMEMYKDYIDKYPFFASKDSPGVAALTPTSLINDIERIGPLVDVIIMSLHWGDDYKPVRRLQNYFGRLAIDLGADAVIGHHSHSNQPVELYKGKPIIYSIGNFVFGLLGKEEYEPIPGVRRKFCCNMPIVINIDLRARKIKSIEFVPLMTQNRIINFTPRRVNAEKSRLILDQLRKDSGDVGNFQIVEGADGPRGLWLL